MGFLAPWFLGGLLALGVPVFVHLLQRHVTTPRPVGSLMFFERGTQSSTRHRRLRYLLLFALRFALLLLLVLAFANPFVRRPASDPGGRLLVIVLDHSFSMRAGTRFVEGKQEALTLLAAKPASQKAQIMALGGHLEVLTQPISDPAQLRSALESISPGDEHASFGDLGHAIQTLAEAVHGPIDLHFVSDLQRTAMPGNFADLALPSNVALQLDPVRSVRPQPNWTVASVDAPAELSDPKDLKRSRVRAVIAGFETPAASRTVSLLVNGKVMATRRVDVPAAGRATVEFAPLDVGYGSNRCEIRVEGVDAFPSDDSSLFTVRRSDPEKVLFVHAADDARSPLYFGAALGAAAQASFALQSTPASLTTDLDPSKYSFVVLSDVVSLPSIFERALTGYVAKGGNVLIALGTRSGRHASIPVWGGEVQDVHDALHTAGSTTVGQVDFTHPAFTGGASQHGGDGWTESKIFYAGVVDPKQARVAARLSDGTPLLLDQTLGQGHVLLFTSGFDNLTNDLPLHPVFVAFVDHVARYLSGSERLSGSRTVDETLELRAAGQAAAQPASVQVVDPEGRRPLSLSEAQTAQTFRLTEAGFYQIRYANGRDAVIGVNPDRRESDLEPIADDVQRLWSGSSNAAPTQAATTSSSRVNAPTVTRRLSLWWYVILLALLTALVETSLASGYLGTQREQA